MEEYLSSLGLGNPLARGIAAGAVAGLAENQLKPSYSYRKDGTPRPSVYTHPEAGDATYLPPGSTALLAAIFFGVFI